MSGAASAYVRRPARWLLPADDTGALDLARELGLHFPAARVLWTRGYRSVAAAEHFLRPRLEDLHDPFLLRDMDRAVSRLRQAIERKEKILLYGDYDVDGTTSIVILKKALDLAGAASEFFVPHRVRDGMGCVRKSSTVPPQTE